MRVISNPTFACWFLIQTIIKNLSNIFMATSQNQNIKSQHLRACKCHLHPYNLSLEKPFSIFQKF